MKIPWFHHQSIKEEYDQKLLDLVNTLKEDWDHDQRTQEAVADGQIDLDLETETLLAKQKFFFIYREARLRRVKNTAIQSSVINYDPYE